jgi:hypothetical protein
MHHGKIETQEVSTKKKKKEKEIWKREKEASMAK